MKTKLFLSVSALALIVTAPALADQQGKNPAVEANANAHKESTGSVSRDVENAWEDIKEDTSQAYESIKASVIGAEEGAAVTTVNIDSRMTASGMIGKPVYNNANERVATVKDIILDQNGAATMVIVADGEFPGIDGKLAAFDYGIIARQGKDGDVIMPLSEETIDNAAKFSYDRKDAGEKVRVIPANGLSVAELLDAQLLNPQNENVAEVDNISFRNGHANQLIVAFDQVLGLGGERAAMNYRDAKVVRDGEDLDFQLSANQAAQFEAYKKNAAKAN